MIRRLAICSMLGRGCRVRPVRSHGNMCRLGVFPVTEPVSLTPIQVFMLELQVRNRLQLLRSYAPERLRFVEDLSEILAVANVEGCEIVTADAALRVVPPLPSDLPTRIRILHKSKLSAWQVAEGWVLMPLAVEQ